MQVLKPIILFAGCLLIVACNHQPKKVQSKGVDTVSVADTISSKNTDIDTVENIDPPKKSQIIDPAFAVDNFFGIWTSDPTGPHADFEIDKDHFLVVDYDGDGRMPYRIHKDTLAISYPDGIEKFIIKKVTKDSLVLTSQDFGATSYVRWQNH